MVWERSGRDLGEVWERVWEGSGKGSGRVSGRGPGGGLEGVNEMYEKRLEIVS